MFVYFKIELELLILVTNINFSGNHQIKRNYLDNICLKCVIYEISSRTLLFTDKDIILLDNLIKPLFEAEVFTRSFYTSVLIFTRFIF